MANNTSAKLFSAPDLQFLLTFVLGMGGFWLSGNLLNYLPTLPLPHNPVAAYTVGLVIALLIYGAIIFGWTWLILGRRRSLKSAVTAAVVAIALGLLTSLILTWMSSHQLGLRFELMVFALYVAYGAYYVIAWAVARKLAA